MWENIVRWRIEWRRWGPWSVLQELRVLGRDAADAWLQDGRQIGKNSSMVEMPKEIAELAG